MSRDHRRDYHRAWSRLTPPLRPHPNVVRAVRREIGDDPGPTLLLGVTPELADISPNLVAIDRNHSMVLHIWPGDTATRRSVVGDWRASPFATGCFASCVGDGSLAGPRWADETERVLDGVARSLRSGGKFVCRAYVPPERGESAAALRELALAGGGGNFHAFKIRLAMAIADAARRTRVSDILRTFDDLFPSRDEAAAIAGWKRDEIDTIDFYKDSSVAFHFPTRAELLAFAAKVFADPHFVETEGYDLAELCPLLVATT
jgi:SAM-dependent methyltransferase